MLISFLFAVMSQASAISMVTPYARHGSEVLLAGDNLGSATAVRIYSAMDSRLSSITEANQIEVIHDALDAGPSVDWNAVGANLPITRLTGFSSQLLRFTVSLEGSGTVPRTIPIRVNNAGGNSSNWVLNKPELWSILGSPTTRLSSGRTYAVIGRNLASVTRILQAAGNDTSAWLRRSVSISSVSNPSGTPLVVTTSSAHGLSTGNRVRIYNVSGHAVSGLNATHTITVVTSTTFSLDGTTGTGGAAGTGGQASILFRCPVIFQRGGGNTTNFATAACHTFDFRIPSTVPAGSYKFAVFTNENVWGVSNTIDVTVLDGGTESWIHEGGSPRGVTTIPLEIPVDVSSVSNPSGTDCVVTTASPHGLRDGCTVDISGVVGHARPVNSRWTVTIIDDDQFSLDDCVGNAGAAGTGGLARPCWKTGDDISHALQQTVFLANSLATADVPVMIQIPAGEFYLSHTLILPGNVGIRGAGMDQTKICPNPELRDQSTSSFVAGAFATNLNVYDDDASTTSNYGANVDSGVFSGSTLNPDRSALVYLKGSNTRIEAITLAASPDQWRRTIVDTLSVANGVDNVAIDQVCIENSQANINSDGGTFLAPAGLLLFQNHADWRISRSKFLCNRCIVAVAGSQSTQASNGINQRWLIEDCIFTAPTPINGGSSATFLGTNWLVTNCHFDQINRGMTSNSGSYPYQSVVAFCHFSEMGQDFGGAESLLFEHRQGRYFPVVSATSTTAVVANDSFNMTGHIVAIVQGKGMGQYRRISASSYSAPNNTITVDKAWSVTPDSTSRVVIDGMVADCSFVANTWEDTKGGLNFYGSAAGIVIETNSFQKSREGVIVDIVNSESAEPDQFQWAGWVVMDKNQFDDSSALRLQACRSIAFAGSYSWPLIMGVSYRGNEIAGESSLVVSTGVGLSQSASSATSTLLDSTPVVVGVHMKGNTFLSDKGRYDFAPVIMPRLMAGPLVVFGRSTSDLLFDTTNSIDGVLLTTSQAARARRPYSQSFAPGFQTIMDMARDLGGIIGPATR